MLGSCYGRYYCRACLRTIAAFYQPLPVLRVLVAALLLVSAYAAFVGLPGRWFPAGSVRFPYRFCAHRLCRCFVFPVAVRAFLPIWDCCVCLQVSASPRTNARRARTVCPDSCNNTTCLLRAYRRHPRVRWAFRRFSSVLLCRFLRARLLCACRYLLTGFPLAAAPAIPLPCRTCLHLRQFWLTLPFATALQVLRFLLNLVLFYHLTAQTASVAFPYPTWNFNSPFAFYCSAPEPVGYVIYSNTTPLFNITTVYTHNVDTNLTHYSILVLFLTAVFF